ncbi:MAG TPA: GNAT family protein [Lacunisphaera sp.]
MPPVFDPQPVLLAGRHVRLEPLGPGHVAGLFAAATPEVFRYLLIPPFRTAADADKYVADALAAQATGAEVAFATVSQEDGRVVGTTRFLDIRRPHRGLEIGWTWISPGAQRTAVNTEAKYLMLRQAFEGWGALRVQLKTDANNAQSRAAILRLGASFEGVLRKQMLRPHDGYERDTAMFSIIAPEWPAVKAGLEAKLQRSSL